MKTEKAFAKNIYWMPEQIFDKFKEDIRKTDFKLSSVMKTPCETLKASGKKVRYATPQVFNRLCPRQGSWYRESNKAGQILVVSEEKLSGQYGRYLNASISESDFVPDRLPSSNELEKLIKSDAYRNQRPDEWEAPGVKDSVMFKILFSLTGFWGWGDNLKSHWLNQRSNHANFLAKKYTAEIDGESVPYSVTGNDGVCSSCVEFFNIIGQDSRKMVHACPGSITFANVKRNTYYDVNPIRYIALQEIV
ncbi:MAG: hypothetical protein OEM38_07045 [Gammaproteobacteria bacterium]|nr:hypothetical protein [Gammaproteobacteria bacterium]